jgi:hypothetical protein
MESKVVRVNSLPVDAGPRTRDTDPADCGANHHGTTFGRGAWHGVSKVVVRQPQAPHLAGDHLCNSHKAISGVAAHIA